MLNLIPWAGTSIMAWRYTPAATDRQLETYRREIVLDVQRRNRKLDPRDIRPLNPPERLPFRLLD